MATIPWAPHQNVNFACRGLVLVDLQAKDIDAQAGLAVHDHIEVLVV